MVDYKYYAENKLLKINRKRHKQKLPLSQCVQELELSLQMEMITAKSNFESKIVQDFAPTNSSMIYNYLQSVSKSKGIPSCLRLNSDYVTTDKEKTRVIKSLFPFDIHKKFPCVLSILNGAGASSNSNTQRDNNTCIWCVWCSHLNKSAQSLGCRWYRA